MRIGIDISQIVHEGTGVEVYVRSMVESLLRVDSKNEYVLFGASVRRRHVFQSFYATLPRARVRLVTVPVPPIVLDILWNRLHVMPVETFIGPVDVFWSSDWTQPPLTSAAGVTTIHDLSTMLFSKEMDARIVATHARRLGWVKKECRAIFCDSESTKKDIAEQLHIPEGRLRVVYPGISL
jgi:glycosyltransferase involved in cell wall biosynthesis